MGAAFLATMLFLTNGLNAVLLPQAEDGSVPALSLVVTRREFAPVPVEFDGEAPLIRVGVSELTVQGKQFRESLTLKKFHAGNLVSEERWFSASDGEARRSYREGPDPTGTVNFLVTRARGRELLDILRDPLTLTDTAILLCDCREQRSFARMLAVGTVEATEDSESGQVLLIRDPKGPGPNVARAVIDQTTLLPKRIELLDRAGKLAASVEVETFERAGDGPEGWIIGKMRRDDFQSTDGTDRTRRTSTVEMAEVKQHSARESQGFVLATPEASKTLDRTDAPRSKIPSGEVTAWSATARTVLLSFVRLGRSAQRHWTVVGIAFPATIFLAVAAYVSWRRRKRESIVASAGLATSNHMPSSKTEVQQ